MNVRYPDRSDNETLTKTGIRRTTPASMSCRTLSTYQPSVKHNRLLKREDQARLKPF